MLHLIPYAAEVKLTHPKGKLSGCPWCAKASHSPLHVKTGCVSCVGPETASNLFRVASGFGVAGGFGAAGGFGVASGFGVAGGRRSHVVQALWHGACGSYSSDGSDASDGSYGPDGSDASDSSYGSYSSYGPYGSYGSYGSYGFSWLRWLSAGASPHHTDVGFVNQLGVRVAKRGSLLGGAGAVPDQIVAGRDRVFRRWPLVRPAVASD